MKNFFAFFLICSIYLIAQKSETNDFGLIKKILYKDILNTASFKNGIKRPYVIKEENKKDSLTIEIKIIFPKGKIDPKKHYYTLQFVVKSGGTLLSEKDYLERKKRFLENDLQPNMWKAVAKKAMQELLKDPEFSKLSPEKREKIKKHLQEDWTSLTPFFPSIGKRSVYGWIIGPNGGGDGIIFTSIDECYDIDITNGNHLPNSFKGESQHFPSVKTIAKTLSESYEKFIILSREKKTSK